MIMMTRNVVMFVDGIPTNGFASLGTAAQEAADALREIGNSITDNMSQVEIEPINLEGIAKMYWEKPRHIENWQGQGKRRKPKMK